eukprot:TRINITY_DN65716_c0_g1_i1.p2 TRINITY_DN65716_c0_g1~~TRINITY_DN65716_c0_g1_i1.p2  ORF type:complete len:138 (+),score=45.31 TRINITY_DN65716_c0_g1_i1:95-508(+)
MCLFFFFSSRRRHTRCREVSWARRCVQETGKEVREQKYIPSFIPSGKEDNFQFFSGSDYGEKKELEEQIRSCELLLRQDSIQGKFDGYYYDVKSAADVSSTRGIIITIPPECKSPSSSSSTKKSKQNMIYFLSLIHI